MGLEIIEHGSVSTVTKYYLYYRWKNRGNTGFSFPCNEVGEILLNEMGELEQKIYEACEFGEYSKEVELQGMICDSHLKRKHTVGRCVCGEVITLSKFKVQCPKCHSIYTQLGTQEN